MTQLKARHFDGRAPSPIPRDPCILLVDDHPLIRRAVCSIIEMEWTNASCIEAGDESTAMDLFRNRRVDLVVLDLVLGDSNGLEFLKWTLQMAPDARVLVLSMHEESTYAERVIRAGARGYINKSASPEAIINAIRSVLEGYIYLSPQITGKILLHMGGRTEEAVSEVELLSDREMETFESIGAGLGSRQIAQRLCVSVKTVEAYRQRIKDKLGISTSPELARRAVEWVLTNA